LHQILDFYKLLITKALYFLYYEYEKNC